MSYPPPLGSYSSGSLLGKKYLCNKIENLIGKLNFYKLIPYLTDGGVPPNRPHFSLPAWGPFNSHCNRKRGRDVMAT